MPDCLPNFSVQGKRGNNKMKSVIVFADRELNTNRESGPSVIPTSRLETMERDNAQPQHFLAWQGCQ
jgi:hypothetical protein